MRYPGVTRIPESLTRLSIESHGSRLTTHDHLSRATCTATTVQVARIEELNIRNTVIDHLFLKIEESIGIFELFSIPLIEFQHLLLGHPFGVICYVTTDVHRLPDFCPNRTIVTSATVVLTKTITPTTHVRGDDVLVVNVWIALISYPRSTRSPPRSVQSVFVTSLEKNVIPRISSNKETRSLFVNKYKNVRTVVKKCKLSKKASKKEDRRTKINTCVDKTSAATVDKR